MKKHKSNSIVLEKFGIEEEEKTMPYNIPIKMGSLNKFDLEEEEKQMPKGIAVQQLHNKDDFTDYQVNLGLKEIALCLPSSDSDISDWVDEQTNNVEQGYRR